MIDTQILREVMLENRKEVMLHNVVRRNISLDGFERQVLVGVRRAGKSYILYGKIQELISQGYNWDEIIYINFEDERLTGMMSDDLNKILEIHATLSNKRPMLFLDEIQNIDGWEKFARRLADNKYAVYITGSNAKMLSTDVSSALGGRYLTREVFPLQFDEYLRINGIDPHDPLLTATTDSRAILMRKFDEYLKFGGFPECATSNIKRDYLTSLYQKIFLGDIAARHRIENLFALRIMFKKLAESVMRPLSFTRVTNIVSSTGVKIGKNTVINYLGYAADAYLIIPLRNMLGNLTEKETNPKYYFIDNGLISLLALDVKSSLLENVVALKLIATYGSKDAVYFYNNGVEVDFYVPETETAIQVCWSLNKTDGTFERETKALVKVKSQLQCKHNIIVTYQEEDFIEVGGVQINVIPVWKFLLSNLRE